MAAIERFGQIASTESTSAKARAYVWEQYETDPSTEPNAQNWKTRVFLALEP